MLESSTMTALTTRQKPSRGAVRALDSGDEGEGDGLGGYSVVQEA